MKNSYLEDSNGNHSSKRLFGGILVTIGMIMGCILFSISIFKVIADTSSALKVVEFILFSGCGLLGISVAENLFKEKQRD